LPQDRDGIVWAATTSGLWRFEHSTWQQIVTGNFNSVGFDRDGILWGLTEGKVFCQRPGRKQIQLAEENRSVTLSTKFTLDADGAVVTSLAMDQRAPKSSSNSEDRLAAYPVLRKDCGQIIDRANGFWVVCNDASLLHFERSDQGYNFLNKANASNSETYDLNPNSEAKLVDREGNIWFGSTTELHRFFYSPTVKQELPKAPASLFAFAAADNGAVWSSAGTPTSIICRMDRPKYSRSERGGWWLTALLTKHSGSAGMWDSFILSKGNCSKQNSRQRWLSWAFSSRQLLRIAKVGFGSRLVVMACTGWLMAFGHLLVAAKTFRGRCRMRIY
jgi:hypothetical protein